MSILPATGPISLNDIQTEFGGTNPIGLNEYYAGGSYVGSQVTYTNYSAGLSGDYRPNVTSANEISLSRFRGASKSIIHTWATTPYSSGYSSSNSTSFYLSYLNGGYNTNTGETYLITTELHPSTSWYYSNTKNCTLAITAGTSSSIAVPFYYNKQWRLTIDYNGSSNLVTIGGYYGGGGSTNYPNGGAWLQGYIRTS